MWFRKSKPAPAAPQAARILTLQKMPERVYAIGDIHGCFDAYQALRAGIVADMRRDGAGGLIVILGDMIDRGPASAEVISSVMAPPHDGVQTVCLGGNHEAMMLDFLNDPSPDARWLAHGGRETLASYGVYLRDDTSSGALLAQVEGAISPEHRAFLSGLPLGLSLPGYFLCHAAMDPARPLNAQRPEDLIWGNPRKMPAMPQGLIQVHGHVPCAQAHLEGGRINVDTHCYDSGLLSAAVLSAQQPLRFVTTQ